MLEAKAANHRLSRRTRSTGWYLGIILEGFASQDWAEILFPENFPPGSFASMTSLRRRRGKKGTHIVHGAVPPSQCGSNISFNMFKSKTGVAETKEARFMALVKQCRNVLVNNSSNSAPSFALIRSLSDTPPGSKKVRRFVVLWSEKYPTISESARAQKSRKLPP